MPLNTHALFNIWENLFLFFVSFIFKFLKFDFLIRTVDIIVLAIFFQITKINIVFFTYIEIENYITKIPKKIQS